MLAHFGHTGKETHVGINRANLENVCCMAAFLRGAFLTCGTVTDPSKEYHLEFTVPYRQLALQLITLLEEVEEIELHPALVCRKGIYVVYIKGSEKIEELLVYMGAAQAAMNLMQVKMIKEVRNHVNRTTNFETANINKTAQAAASANRSDPPHCAYVGNGIAQRRFARSCQASSGKSGHVFARNGRQVGHHAFRRESPHSKIAGTGSVFA